MVRAREDIDELERRIGYRFLDRALLDRALTHATFHEGRPGEDNRRLAFLGDAVLELAVREACFEDKILAKRGDLSVEADRSVPDKEVASFARALDLNAWIKVGKGEYENSAGEERRLADAFEAIAGAIYIEAGNHAFQVIRRLMKL